ncbi:MAG: copper resistance protein NlpE [Spirochaetaceae bacterium]|nr:copper resistance protein NlpE [Spirochaetaceae bacterium]GMO53822.1 MAG: copper resistance protein NlpE N-terminal domain-containing protein [Treponemataceae bacterium]
MKKLVCICLVLSGILLACRKEGAKSDGASVGENSESAVDIHNTRNSVNWEGTYTGTIPAASGPGINVTLVLNKDESYKLRYIYIDHESEGPLEAEGKFSWDSSGGKIILDSDMVPKYYRIGENIAIQLDIEGNEITGDLASSYVLNKNQD